jgi:hypothetical protein
MVGEVCEGLKIFNLYKKFKRLGKKGLKRCVGLMFNGLTVGSIFRFSLFESFENFEVWNTHAPFTFRGKGWGWGLQTPNNY